MVRTSVVPEHPRSIERRPKMRPRRPSRRPAAAARINAPMEKADAGKPLSRLTQQLCLSQPVAIGTSGADRCHARTTLRRGGIQGRRAPKAGQGIGARHETSGLNGRTSPTLDDVSDLLALERQSSRRLVSAAATPRRSMHRLRTDQIPFQGKPRSTFSPTGWQS